jgi:outer membrane receptor protein involved in Fe transport
LIEQQSHPARGLRSERSTTGENIVRKSSLLAGIAAAAFTTAVQAQPAAAPPAPPPTTSSRTTTYDAAYFAQFAPRTALDIAQRVPGFTLDLGNNQSSTGVDVRGFAGTAGNVVINGARPSAKAETLDTTLSRIPAQRVVRVELGPGDLFGSDYAGKSQVLNIILSQEAGIDANVSATGTRRYTGYINRDITASALIRRGASTFNLSGGLANNKQYEEGTDTLTDPATGELVEFRRKHNVYFNRDPYLSAAWALEHGPTSAFRLNARWQPSRFDLFQRNRVTPSDGPVHDDNLHQHYRDPVIEIGGDVTRPLAGGAIKFVGLATRRKRNDFDAYVERDGLLEDNPAVVGGFEQLVKARRNETIGRASWTRSNLWGLSFEAGAEGSLYTHDDADDDVEIVETRDRDPVDLSIADATVKEKRGEVYVNLGKNLSPALRLDGGLNYEFSTLTVRGDATADRKLKFLKPNLTVDWKPGGGWHTQFSVRRTVAQLDFYDFISLGELSTNRINGGNADLQPQRSWEFRGTVEHALLGDGLVKLDFGYDLISMLQDRILIFDEKGKAFDAPGNLGTGRRSFATLTVDAPLGRLWKGLRAKFNGTLQRTRVDDPITGQPRKFSGFYPDWQWELDVRRDAGAFSYGFDISDNQRFTFYRTDEFDTNFNRGAYMTAFLEYRPTARTSIRFDAGNVLNTHAARSRLLFDPNRLQGEAVINEFRDRNRHRSFGITLKQSFGGGSAKVASAK